MKTITINGCFDVLHTGHLDLLDYAKTKGNYLIVLLNSDESIKKLKGNTRPINNQKNRKRFLESLKQVDKVLIFNSEKDLHKKLKQIQPKYHIKSKGFVPILVALEEKAILPAGRILYFKPKTNNSSTNILRRIGLK
jgi:rfaE bifunctional protein nucleotidyltransferase chain/domain